MSDIKQGGYAFPSQNASQYIHGMSLRDYFAGQALTAILGLEIAPEMPEKYQGKSIAYIAAHQSYAIADAMIEARGMP